MRRLFTFLAFCSFASLTYAQATFESQASGDWYSASTWTIVSGSDSNGDNLPDANDAVVINSGHTINLLNTYNHAQSVTVLSGGVINSSGRGLVLYGNFTNQGTISGKIYFYFRGSSTFSSTSTITNCSFYLQGGTANITVNIAAGTTINNSTGLISFQNTSTLNNQGTVTIGRISYANNLCTWNNLANSSLTLRQPPASAPTVGVLNASAVPNTVTYLGASTAIKPATYYNLTLSAVSTKSLISNVTILNNLTLSSGNVLNANNFNITVGGNWTNNANTNVTNQATVTFNTSGTSSITRSSTELFNNLVINGSGTIQLGTSINVTNDLTLSNGTLDVSASNYTVSVGGDLTNNGNFITQSGLVNLNGSAAQNVSGTSGFQFYALTLNNAAGAVMNSAATVNDVLTVTNGNFNSNGNVTLTSDASKTARLGEVGAGGSFSGTMVIQKHVSARVKSWHDMSSPVQGTTIFDWDDEMYMSGFSTVDSPAGIAGVDGSAGSFKSVRTYDEPTATYVNVTNSLTVLDPGKGYYIWLADNTSNWAAKTYDSRGVPNFGTQNIPLAFSASAGAYAGLNLVGNPFASAIDYSMISQVNTDGHAYGFDNGVWTDYGTNAILTPHQGFWAYATGAGASISIPESAKSSVTATSFHRTAPNYSIKFIYTNSEVQFFNEAKVNIADGATEKWDVGVDAIFMRNPDADASTIAFNAGQMKLLTNAVNDNQNDASLPIELFSPKAGLYHIQPSVLSTGEYKYVWIENLKTGEKFNLDKPVAVYVETAGENNDYVLRLSKLDPQSQIAENILANDLMIFNYDQTLNLKSNQMSHHITRLSIYDLTGKLILDYTELQVEQNAVLQIDISQLINGMYVVAATDESGRSTLRKIIK